MNYNALTPCTVINGNADILKRPLRTLSIPDALMIPMNRPRKPGVFNADGSIVIEAAYRRGLPELHLPLEDKDAHCLGPHAERAPSEFEYVYVGHLTGHYGHFLFSVLARLWSLPRPLPANVRLVALNGFRIGEMLEFEFARAIFGTLGITSDSFVAATRPISFSNLLVPEPAVEENIGGACEFADLCHWIGNRTLPVSEAHHVRPVYLTKAHLRSGVNRIVNESVLCAALEKRGFEIIAPETLPFAAQICLWKKRLQICGIAGSPFLTSIFATGHRYIAVTTEEWINSNQIIFDKLNGAEALSFSPKTKRETLPPSSQFTTEIWLENPEGVASDLANEV